MALAEEWKMQTDVSISGYPLTFFLLWDPPPPPPPSLSPTTAATAALSALSFSCRRLNTSGITELRQPAASRHLLGSHLTLLHFSTSDPLPHTRESPATLFPVCFYEKSGPGTREPTLGYPLMEKKYMQWQLGVEMINHHT